MEMATEMEMVGLNYHQSHHHHHNNNNNYRGCVQSAKASGQF